MMSELNLIFCVVPLYKDLIHLVPILKPGQTSGKSPCSFLEHLQAGDWEGNTTDTNCDWSPFAIVLCLPFLLFFQQTSSLREMLT